MRKSTGAKLTDDVRRVRVLLAVAVAPPYLYYSLVVARNPYSVITAVCAAALVVSQYLRSKSWNEFLTPVAGCPLNASAICTTGFERSPFLFLVLIPLLTYGTERDAVWVFRSVMLNTVIMAQNQSKRLPNGYEPRYLLLKCAPVVQTCEGIYASLPEGGRYDRGKSAL